MNSAERIRMTINFVEPDKVPYDLAGTTVTGICKNAFTNAMRFKKYSDKYNQKEIDPISQIVTPVEETLVLLKSDTRRIGARRIPDYENVRKINGDVWSVTDILGCNWQMDITKDIYYNQCNHPLSDYNSLSEGLSNYSIRDWDDGLQELMVNDIEEQIQYINDNCGIADRNSAGFTENSLRIRGYEQWYMDVLTDPEGVEKLFDMILESKKQYWVSLFNWLKKNNLEHKIQIVSECDDLGSQVSTIIDPALIRKMVIPYLKNLWSFLKKEMPHVKTFLHSCGAIREILPDLIEAGLDIYNPVQFNAANMDLKGLKRDFGKDLIFWGGGIDTQTTLSKGSVQEVEDEVKRILDIMAPGGGFVFSPVHNIQDDVPPQNFWAMWETFMKYREY